MSVQIERITLPLPLGMGQVNCYLLAAGDRFVLIDCGGTANRPALLARLAAAGCRPENLSVVLLTHGDFDHIGSAGFLQASWGARIGLGRDDLEMASRGDMFVNRKRPHLVIRALVPVMTRFGKKARFQPDFFLAHGDDLSAYGVEAEVIGLPGHSLGSVGIRLADGTLFCGDLLENTNGPALGTIMDDMEAAESSLERLKEYPIGRVYPGHGEPFEMRELR